MSPAWGWLIVGLGLLGLLVYDGALVNTGRKSMSRWLMEAYRNRPYIIAGICLSVGALLGHLFWPLESCLEMLR